MQYEQHEVTNRIRVDRVLSHFRALTMTAVNQRVLALKSIAAIARL
jgi:hypothetical protein